MYRSLILMMMSYPNLRLYLETGPNKQQKLDPNRIKHTENCVSLKPGSGRSADDTNGAEGRSMKSFTVTVRRA